MQVIWAPMAEETFDAINTYILSKISAIPYYWDFAILQIVLQFTKSAFDLAGAGFTFVMLVLLPGSGLINCF